MSGGLELGSQRWVHANHQLLLLCHGGVPILDLLSNPSPKGITEDNRTDVDYPLLRDLRQVHLVWKVVVHISLCSNELHDLLQAQVLVLRHVDRLDISVQHVTLLAIEEILEEVDCGVVCNERGDQYTVRRKEAKRMADLP